ncbi:MAG TPA: divergent polysaccharide deacetylase family protein [Desulfosalsimonadaceae bacterium]|nr:divergent polysaccharide deacetylase family protein [Desulfosalsimonadaceae bacterium]
MTKTKKNTAGTQKGKSTARKPAAKKASAKKPAAKKPAAKKPAAKKPAAKKSAAKRPAGKSASAKKAPSKRTPAKKSTASANSAAKKSAGSKKTPARKSSSSRPASRKPPKKPASGPFGRFAGIYGVFLFVLLAAGLSGGIYGWLQGGRAGDAPAISEDASQKAGLPKKVKQFEKSSGQAAPPAQPKTGSKPVETARAKVLPVPEPQPAASDDRPKVALIIDDMGHQRDMAEKFFNLDARLTYAVLPFSRYHREIAEAAARRGYQVMLHLPMEPNEYPDIDPGPGALLTAMTPDERLRQLKTDLGAVPHIKGVNNHMGSKMTAMSDQMNQVFTVLKRRGLFFIDSRTSSASQCRSSARLFQLPFAERDVFLDHVQTRQAIAQKIDELINVAEITGAAIGIGHPHEITYAVLSEKLPELTRRVRLVSASELVD